MNERKGDPLAVGSAMMPLVESTAELTRLFAEHYRRVLLAAYRITGDMSDAEDVAQAVFLRLSAGGHSQVTNTGSYFYRAAINGALDLLRGRKRNATESLEDARELVSIGSSPEAGASNRQLRDLLRIAISDLPPRAAEMFAMRYLEDFDNQEIAKLLGTSQAVVAVTLFNARSRLKKRLKEWNGDLR